MRGRVVATGLMCLMLSACPYPGPEPPFPDPPSYEFAATFVETVTLTGRTPGVFTFVEGTITNTGTIPGRYEIGFTTASAETGPAYVANNVLPGQTAIWRARWRGKVTVTDFPVTASPVSGPVTPTATSVITSVRPIQHRDLGPATEVTGTLTNTGTAAQTLVVELQGDTGQVAANWNHCLPSGETVTWTVLLLGTVMDVRLVRTALFGDTC